MNPGLALTSLSIVAAFGNIAFYYPKMMGNRVALRPRLEQSVMILALLLAGAGFFLQPGILGYVLGGIAIVPAGLFLFATAKSGLDYQQPAMAVGEMAPDFSATKADGTELRLSDLRGSPVLLKFYRGYWCPYCVAELAQLDRFAKDFSTLGVKLVAVSSDRPDELRAFMRKQSWAITLLADPELAAHRLYNVQQRNFTPHNVQQRNFTPRRGPFRDLAIPSTILIDADGRVLLIEQAIDFRVRPQAEVLLAKTRALLGGRASDAVAADSCEVCVA